MRYIVLLSLLLVSVAKSYAQDDSVVTRIDPMTYDLPKPKINLQEFMSRELKYPEEAYRKRIEGKVYVKVVVKKNGSIDTSTVTLAKGLPNGGEGINDEALRVVRLLPEGSFEPGKNGGEPVNVWISIPINFSFRKNLNWLGHPKKEKKPKKRKSDE